MSPAVAVVTRSERWRERARRAGSILMHPICVREFRGMFRAQRFFWMYFSFLALVALVVIASAIGLSVRETANPARIGVSLFGIFVVAQVIGLVLVVPAFSCTALVGERERHTYDLLITSTLEPCEIVWGKFSAVLGYAAFLIVGAFPLVSLGFLFGGISVGMLALAAGGFLLLASILVALGLFVSSVSKSYTRAIITSYVATFALMGLIGAGLAEPLSYFVAKYLEGRTMRRPFSSATPRDVYVAYVAGLVYAYLTLIFFFLISATNRLKPAVANRTTNLKVFYVIFLGVGMCGWCAFLTSMSAAGGGLSVTPSFLTGGLLSSFMVPTVFALLSTAFACESPEVSLRIRRRSERWTGAKRWLRLWIPGNLNGVAYVLVVNVALIFGFIAYHQTVLLPQWVNANSALGRYVYTLLPATGISIVAFLFLEASIGAFWATWFRRPALPYVFQILTVVLMLVTAPAFRAIWYPTLGREERRRAHLLLLDATNFPITMASIWDGLTNGGGADIPYAWVWPGTGSRIDDPAGAPMLPLWVAFTALNVLLGALFYVWARHRVRRREAAILRLASAPSPIAERR